MDEKSTIFRTHNGDHLDIDKFDDGWLLFCAVRGASIVISLSRDDMIALHDMIRAKLKWPNDDPMKEAA